jgi:hypothetical protein
MEVGLNMTVEYDMVLEYCRVYWSIHFIIVHAGLPCTSEDMVPGTWGFRNFDSCHHIFYTVLYQWNQYSETSWHLYVEAQSGVGTPVFQVQGHCCTGEEQYKYLYSETQIYIYQYHHLHIIVASTVRCMHNGLRVPSSTPVVQF